MAIVVRDDNVVTKDEKGKSVAYNGRKGVKELEGGSVSNRVAKRAEEDHGSPFVVHKLRIVKSLNFT